MLASKLILETVPLVLILNVSLFKNLEEKFRLEKSVNVVGVSFEEFLLPHDNFKVFSNIPFLDIYM